MKIDGFLLAMLAVVSLAVAWPALGASTSPVPIGAITTAGIAFIFFLHGANLNRESIKSGLKNWRLHVFVQSSTFILFPLIGVVLLFVTKAVLPWEARIGLFFLCALSSTISSSIAMVALARGNMSAAVFNASLSGLIGMIVTPILMGLVIATHLGEDHSVVSSIIEIALKLLMPFVAGHLLRPILGTVVATHKNWLSSLDRAIILLIVYASFSQSTADGLWSRYEPVMLGLIFLIVACLLATVLMLTQYLARTMAFTREDEITAVFCGSKKSLANGAPIAQTLFGTNPAIGMILLPLLIYHQLQLLVCTLLAQRYAAGDDRTDRVSQGRSA
ncbi:MAG: bile acid:sodium symporter family protein [Blastomonas sp.]